MKERWIKFAYNSVSVIEAFESTIDRHTFRRRYGKVILEDHAQLVEATLPNSTLLAGYRTHPLHQVERAIGILFWLGDEALQRRRNNAVVLRKDSTKLTKG